MLNISNLDLCLTCQIGENFLNFTASDPNRFGVPPDLQLVSDPVVRIIDLNHITFDSDEI